MVERMFLPDGLDDMPPGPGLAVALAAVDRSRVNGYDAVRLLRARARQLAHDQAGLLADMAEVAHCAPGGPHAPPRRIPVNGSRPFEFAGCEISAALMITRHAAEDQLGLALLLAELPAVWAALDRGVIDLPRARVIVDGVAGLPDPAARAVADAALRHAPAMTSGRLRAHLATLVIQTDPEAATTRYRRGVQARRVVHGHTPQHTAYLSGCDLPADRAARAHARIEAIAAQLKRGADPRSLDQLRADVYLDLLDGAHLPTPAAGRPGVADLIVPLDTLAGLTANPGLIPGWGPVLADIARQIADNAGTWRYSLTDRHRRLIRHGRITARPVTIEYDFVRARDRHCRYPTCATPAGRCDVDHTTQRQHGGTHTRTNLSLACRHHHRAKDEGGYHLRQLGNGTLRWTTPLGHKYTTDPDQPLGPNPRESEPRNPTSSRESSPETHESPVRR